MDLRRKIAGRRIATGKKREEWGQATFSEELRK
jgi:hypothetical protein